MIFLVQALFCEAKPFIDHFQLKQDHSHNQWRVFSSEKVALIISGTGKVRSSMATTYLLCQFPKEHFRNSIAVNLGICGAGETQGFRIGDLVVINQIMDHGNSRNYFPDMMVKHSLVESGVETFDSPVTSESVTTLPLVDMEAAGFYEAVSVFFDSHQIYCLKLVSDRLSESKVSEDWVKSKFDRYIKVIEEFFGNALKVYSYRSEVLSPEEEKILGDLGTLHKFSVTQKNMLKKTAENYVCRHQKNLDLLHRFLKLQSESKYQVNQIFNEILSTLTHP